MSNKTITDLSALATPASGDKIPIVDVSDTTDSPDGTTKYIEVDDLVTGAPPATHASTHQNGGGDEISVAGLSGVLADPQVPITENVQDIIGTAVVAGTGISVAYNDGTGETTVTNTAAGGSGGFGDVVGPGSATGNALVRMDGTTGKLIQNSTVTLDDTGAITVPEMAAPSTPASGKVTVYAKSDGKLYIKDDAGAETDLTGTAPSGSAGGALSGTYPNPSVKTVIAIAASDETTALTTGTAKVTFRMPHAMTLTDIRASLSTAQASGSTLTVDVNEGGTTILSTKITIDNTEKTSTTAATPPAISDASLADDAEITVDIDQVGDGTAKGLKVYLIGTRL